jgi:acetoacetyl-CoA synthetase
MDLSLSDPVTGPVKAGELLWAPTPERVANANLTAYLAWLKQTRSLDFAGYPELWQWSVTETDAFWQSIWDYNDIIATAQPTAVLGRREMPGAQWFPGAELNYAENVMGSEAPGEVALYYQSETTALTPLLWDDFAGNVRILATRLRDLGVAPGDRVASMLPNIPEAVIAMLAVTSLGAIWTSVSPDFGWRGVLDRFRQLQPTVLICTGGYQYNGKPYDRSRELRQIIDDLDCLRHVIYLPFNDVPAPAEGAQNWHDLLEGEPVARADFTYHHGPFDMPLWILFSSGTTGLPKAITHSHGGILLEQLKLQRLNMNLSRGDVLFFYTTTGWMMWNFMVSSLVLGVRPLLYDGNPAYPEPDALWRMAAQAKVTLFGGSPAYAASSPRTTTTCPPWSA